MAHTVLIADDNLIVRQGLCELFSREADFLVCGAAENGREAVEKAQQLHPDLILLDLLMPVINGLDAARVLKQVTPEVPIIMYSACTDSFIENEARSAGVSACVSKSDDVSVLLENARRLVEPDWSNQTGLM